MIKYNSGSFGFSILYRIHGSAVYKALLPSLISSAIFLALFESVDLQSEENRLFLHPYPMGALVSALAFLLAFQANFSYNRYWESITAVHMAHSKWLDVGMELASFHLQAKLYDNRRPPAFGEYPELNSLELARERNNEMTLEELENQLETMEQEDEFEEVMGGPSTRKPSALRLRFRRKKKSDATQEESKERKDSPRKVPKGGKGQQRAPHTKSINATSIPSNSPKRAAVTKSINASGLPSSMSHHKTSKHRSSIQQFADWIVSKPSPVEEKILLENGVVQAAANNRIRAWDSDKPPLFLQEAAHLLSLLSAVAFSTLRNVISLIP